MTLQPTSLYSSSLVCCNQTHPGTSKLANTPQFSGKHKLPQAVRECPVIGIQGGPGSFNEIALDSKGLQDVLGNPESPTTKYLYTSGDVFQQLGTGLIDVGHVAVYNNVGGIVDETMKAVRQTGVRVLGRYSVPIRHALMVRADSDLDQVTVVMGHPQALKQCENSLKERHENLAIEIGKGAMVDPAKIAEMLANHNLDKNIAVVGNTALADIYGLKVVAEDLQDNPNNKTTFMMVAPPKENSILGQAIATVRQYWLAPHLRTLAMSNRVKTALIN